MQITRSGSLQNEALPRKVGSSVGRPKTSVKIKLCETSECINAVLCVFFQSGPWNRQSLELFSLSPVKKQIRNNFMVHPVTHQT